MSTTLSSLRSMFKVSVVTLTTVLLFLPSQCSGACETSNKCTETISASYNKSWVDVLQEGAGFIPPYDTTVYNNAGFVNFTATFNFSTYCPIVTYEDDCRCYDYTGRSVDGLYVIIYTINNISMVDNGTRVDICAHCGDGLKCFPPVYLTVKDKPVLSPDDIYAIATPNGILVEGQKDNDTVIMATVKDSLNHTVHQCNISTLPYLINFTVLPPDIDFNIEFVGVNPAGTGEPLEQTVSFENLIDFQLKPFEVLYEDDKEKVFISFIFNNTFIRPQEVVVNSICILGGSRSFDISDTDNVTVDLLDGTAGSDCEFNVSSGKISYRKMINTRPVAASVHPEITTDGQFNITADFIRGVPELVIQVLTSNGSVHSMQEINLRPDNGRRSLTVLSNVLLPNGSYTVNVFIKKCNGTLLMVESGIPIHCVMKEDDDNDSNNSGGGEPEPDGLEWWIYLIIAVVGLIFVSSKTVAFAFFLIIIRNWRNSNNRNREPVLEQEGLELRNVVNRVIEDQKNERTEEVPVPVHEREVNDEEEHVEEEVMDGREVNNVEEPNNLNEHDQQPPIPHDILQSPVADTGTPDDTRYRQHYNPTPQEPSITDSTDNSAACLISPKDRVPIPGSIFHPTPVQNMSRSGTGFSSNVSETAALLPPPEQHGYLHEISEASEHTKINLVVNSPPHPPETIPQTVQPVQSTYDRSDVPIEPGTERIAIAGISAGTNKSDKDLLVLPPAALQRQFSRSTSQEYRQKILEGSCPTTPTAVTPTDQSGTDERSDQNQLS